jgi:hypothetical protein
MKGDTMTDQTPEPAEGFTFPWEEALVEPSAEPPVVDVDASDPTSFGVRVDEVDPDAVPSNDPAPYVGLGFDRVTLILDELADDTARRDQLVRQGKDAVLSAIRGRADERRAAREAKLGEDGTPSTADLRREAVGAADDSENLTALAGIFLAGATEAKQIAGELLDDLPQRGGKPRASLKVGDGHGFELTVTRSKRTEVAVDADKVIGVLVPWLVGHDTSGRPRDWVEDAAAYAQGAREALGLFRSLLAASPGFKSTALDSLVKRLQNADEDDLATRLTAAYGRVEKGEPSVKLERKPLATEVPEAAPTEEATP